MSGNIRSRGWTIVLFIALSGPGCDSTDPQKAHMPHPAKQPSEETERFHRLVSQRDLGKVQEALRQGADINAPGQTGVTALMLAIEEKDLELAKLLVQHGADPELTDDFNATALRHAVYADFAEGVRFLLALGVDRGNRPRYPLKKIEYPNSPPDVPMPVELKDVMTEAEWNESLQASSELMREKGQNPTVEPVISCVQSVEILKQFLDAGDELNLAPKEVKRALVGLPAVYELRVGPDDYRRHKSPRFGTTNPERMDFPFWKDMIRAGGNTYTARTKFNDTNPFTEPGAVWCYERFGSSLTPLADGRFVQIGGEHEDYYDPDFFIYNDVVVHDGKGEFEIYGYPLDVFPQTDFHSATLCQKSIYIIGCLGYPNQRQPGFTPVYRLTLDTWRIEPVETSGEMPGWIYEHRASYEPASNGIRISKGKRAALVEGDETGLEPNDDEFELDLSRKQWRRVR